MTKYMSFFEKGIRNDNKKFICDVVVGLNNTNQLPHETTDQIIVHFT